MSNVYSVEVIIKSNADLNPFHGVLKETFMPTLRCYSRNEAIKAAIKSLSLLLENECKHLWVRGKCHDCGIEKTDIRPCMCGSCDLCFSAHANQYQNDTDKCDHEHDGKEHRFNDSGGHFKMNKCIKCGEFYT